MLWITPALGLKQASSPARRDASFTSLLAVGGRGWGSTVRGTGVGPPYVEGHSLCRKGDRALNTHKHGFTFDAVRSTSCHAASTLKIHCPGRVLLWLLERALMGVSTQSGLRTCRLHICRLQPARMQTTMDEKYLGKVPESKMWICCTSTSITQPDVARGTSFTGFTG